tara:strand:+ start:1590 stop:2483 length:894 start_codon:yes stop_codon:yes gene_type:complete
MKVCRETETLVILGPAAGLNMLDKDGFEALKQKQKKGVKVLCFSSAMSHALNNDFTPDYFTFVDPQSLLGGAIEAGYPTTEVLIAEKGLNLIKRQEEIKSQVLCWDSVYNGKEAFAAQGLTSNRVNWDQTKEFLVNLEKRGLLEILPIKNILHCDFFNKDASLTTWLNAYKEHQNIVVGYPHGMGHYYDHEEKKYKTTGADDKLTSSILPIAIQKFPSLTSIVLLGFGDPNSFRWYSVAANAQIKHYANLIIGPKQKSAMKRYRNYFKANGISCTTLSKNNKNHLINSCKIINLDDI